MADPVPSGKKWSATMAHAVHTITELQKAQKIDGGETQTFADVVLALAEFDKNGRIQLEFDSEDDQYDIEAMQKQSLQREATFARVLDPQSAFDEIVPRMNVCIMIVGTRGDVQPFIAIAKRLQQDGHRVRLATHGVYRDFVTGYGVEFYPLGGDPKELAAYMVKTGGHIIPMKLETLQKDVPRNMKMIEEILNSTWPAVSAADPDAGGVGTPGKPFQAQAIISNPVTYGHVHVAERLGVPLHIMFPQPWVPTQAFPHPLSNLVYDNKPSKKNYMSYKMVDLLMWQGTEGIVNEFRRDVLGLRKIRKGDGGRDILLDLCIPHAFMWSPALVPKPDDWGHIYDVIGTVSLKEEASKYEPTPELEAFLGNDGGPIFVGFGSMVIDDPKKVTTMIIEASQKANNVRVLIQSSWSDMSGGVKVPSNIMFLGNCPHDWLMPRVCAVVHHGGAGTTAAGLLAGKPTFIVPFFGDQPFWGRAVVTAGVGVEPCPIKSLTADKLYEAFMALQAPNIREQAIVIREVMSKEDGANAAVQCFYRNLPLPSMRCDVDGRNIATHWSQKDKLKLCSECAFVIGSRPENSETDIVDYQFVDYSARGPNSTLGGASSGAGALVHEFGTGIKDIFVKPVQGYKERGVLGAAVGVVKGVLSYSMISPVRGAVLFVDHVATGRYNATRGENERKKNTVLLGNKKVRRAFGYNVTPDSHTAAMNPDEAFKVEKPDMERPHVVIHITDEEKKDLEAKFYEIMTKRNPSGIKPDDFHAAHRDDTSIVTDISNDDYGDLFGTNAESSSESSDDEASVRDSSANKELTQDQLKQQQAMFEAEEIKQKQLLAKIQKTLMPKMNIGLMTVGSWDENVQQFVAIGLRLKADGHRVRIATTIEFRDRVVASGLEFYPLGGTASTMGKYLQYLNAKRHAKESEKGFLGFAKSLASKKYPQIEDVKALIFSLWPACVSADPFSPGMIFRADAIIAHPLVFGQTIVAERLGVPLHCISSTPLTRTQAFPHLMTSSLSIGETYHYMPANSISYDAIDHALMKGMRHVLNDFRSSLGLSGHVVKKNLLTQWRIPTTYLWNPQLLPKPTDWGHEILIAGYVSREQSSDSVKDGCYLSALQAFITSSPEPTPVIYFGFSVGDWDSQRIMDLLKNIQAAAEIVHVRVIFQTYEELPGFQPHSSNTVYQIPSTMSVEKVLPLVQAAFHCGDLSITSRCLAAGKPACVIPRKVTQRFWAQAVVNAGAGIDVLELNQLDSKNLAPAYLKLLSEPLITRARELSVSVSSRDAVDNAVSSFYAQLPISAMTCDLDPRRLARIYDPVNGLKLSYEAHYVVKRRSGDAEGADDTEELKYKPLKYSQRHPPKFSLRRARHGLFGGLSHKTTQFSYDSVKTKAKIVSPGFRDNTKGFKNPLTRQQSLAVEVLDLPEFWTSQTHRLTQTNKINEAYEAILRLRMSR